MSDDILTRAAAYLTDPEADLVHFHRLIHEFIAELEAARAEVERLRARCEPQVYVTTPPCSEYGEGTRGEVRHPIGRCGDPNF